MQTLAELPTDASPYRIAFVAPAVHDDENWIDQLCRADMAQSHVKIVDVVTRKSARGWPLVVHRVVATERDEIVERRIVVVANFIHVAGAVVIRGPRSASFEEPWIEKLIDSIRPDFSGEIVAIADLYDEGGSSR